MSEFGMFRCDNCDGVFPKARSDEDALAESGGLWGDLAEDDRAVLCDDCFNRFMPWVRENHPEALT